MTRSDALALLAADRHLADSLIAAVKRGGECRGASKRSKYAREYAGYTGVWLTEEGRAVGNMLDACVGLGWA